MFLLKCNKLTLGYNNKDILHSFDYGIHSGEYLCIIGRNGCGKTTFLRGLAGVLRPKSGKIELCDNLRRNQIGYLPQITIAQKDFPASVEEIVLSAFQGKSLLLPFYGKALLKRANECLELTRTENLRKESFRELSGGQKQRVLLARALCAAERLLLLDEPTNDIDVNTLRALEEGLENFAGCAVVISHDRWFLDRICTHILAFEGDSQVYFYEGSYTEYEENKKMRLGNEAPKRIRYKKITVI